MHIRAMLQEPFAIRVSRERHERAGAVPCEQHACFLEKFPRCRDVIRQPSVGRNASELLHGALPTVTPLVGGAMIAGIDPPPREHVGASHERDGMMAPNHEDLRSGRTVAQHDDGRRGPDDHVRCHR
jgi:hypothetical protein